MFKTLVGKSPGIKRIFVGEGAQKPPYFLHSRRVYILPTRQGLIFGVLLFAMLLGAINYNNNLGYILTFLLSSLMVVTILMTYRNMLYLKIGPAILKPVFAGKDSTIAIKVDNHNYSSRFAIEYHLPKAEFSICDINANDTSTINLKLNFPRRGLHALPRFILETTYPLGMFRTWSHVELDQAILVYPQPSNDRVLPGSSQGTKEGQHHPTKGSDDFEGLRNYHAGDSLYRIHWKSSARHHHLQTKLYNGNAADELWLRWEDSKHNDIEKRISQLTCWVLLAYKTGLPYGFKIPGSEFNPMVGITHRDNCLQALALYGNNHV